MNVVRAESLGMCFGVRDALRAADRVKNPRDVTIHGELVHNEEVTARLSKAGFLMSPGGSKGAIPESPIVLITAHGISERERVRLTAANKQLIETTCPLVKRVHNAATKLQAEGYFVVLIGRPGHVEVRGIVEDLEHFEVVETAEYVRDYGCQKLGIICQSTTSPDLLRDVRSAIEAMNRHAEIRFIDTICQPTRDNQLALVELIERVDAVVVVGGRNSNNTRELVALCRSRSIPVCHVQSAMDLDSEWFTDYETVGLTAGTSTLDPTIDEVYERLLEFSRSEVCYD